jgi:hypothetical protein
MSVNAHALKQGSKRTASGAVKAPVMESTGVVDYVRHTAEKFDVGRARSSSRAAEVGTLLIFLRVSLGRVKFASQCAKGARHVFCFVHLKLQSNIILRTIS